MSTRWFASRVKELRSIENDPEWYRCLHSTLPTNVIYELRSPDEYWNLDDLSDGSIDFALVDGIERAKCVEAVLPKLRPGAWVLLDNSDKDMTIPDGDLRLAEARLLENATSTWYSTGIPTGLIQATQSLLVRV